MNDPILELRAIGRTYRQAESDLQVLRDVSLTLRRGELAAIVGPSGSGKSTLLHTAGLLEKTEAGEVLLEGLSCGAVSDAQRTELRRHKIGFVYQYHYLLPEFSALENVMIPQMIAGVSKKTAQERAEHLLSCVELAPRALHRPGQLSGGEQQRVAIVRALANKPSLLLADEPTGNLDPQTSERVYHYLRQVILAEGCAVLLATHNHTLAQKMDRIFVMQAGSVIEKTGAERSAL